MADVQDLFYHGIRQQIRRVLDAMGEERIDKGLTAFEDGDSDWSNCFFARAFKGEVDLALSRDPERAICEVLGLFTQRPEGRIPNRLPVRIVYFTFDGNSTLITADEMKQFIIDVRDESRPDEVMRLLRSINYDDIENREIKPFVSCAIPQEVATVG